MQIVIDRIKNYLGLVRFSHTIFALPFALSSMLVAAGGFPEWRIVFWILCCMVAARTAAMTFNRIVDRDIDSLNPRTQSRHLPSGTVQLSEAIGLLLFSIIIFLCSAWKLNFLAFVLSPVALVIICGYSFFKRFSALSHFILGLSLGIAPIGAWIGVTGQISLSSVLLACGVLLWVAGFDVIYALMDEEFDRKTGLHSLVVKYGKINALKIAFVLHVLCVIFITLFGVFSGLGWIFYAGMGIFAVLIVYEHYIVRPDDIARINMAFFNVNGTISIGVFLFTLVDVMMK